MSETAMNGSTTPMVEHTNPTPSLGVGDMVIDTDNASAPDCQGVFCCKFSTVTNS